MNADVVDSPLGLVIAAMPCLAMAVALVVLVMAERRRRR